MTREELKKRVCKEIDIRSGEIRQIGRDIAGMAELGFKERRTSAYVKEKLSNLGLDCVDGIGITGIRAGFGENTCNYKVAILSELDAVKCDGHPQADQQTGAAHACGHNAQLALMIGAAMGLVYSNSASWLGGEAVFFAVPAEEFVELSFRRKLKEEGKIACYSGKQELIKKGYFDDIDAAMMVHAHAGVRERQAFINGSSSAFLAKEIRFIGKEAHAGGAPHEGINALNAAMAAMMCIHAQRETFQDQDGIRVHPILTKGGDLVNIVPADVRMETFVRGNSLSAVQKANEKVDRAVKGAAYAIGAEVEIRDIPGYLPLRQDRNLSELFRNNLSSFLDETDIKDGVDLIGSTDIGDLSMLIPVIQPTMGGYEGAAHSEEFRICDEEMAYIIPAKVLAMTLIDLLWEDGRELQRIKNSFVPELTKEQYLDFLDHGGSRQR